MSYTGESPLRGGTRVAALLAVIGCFSLLLAGESVRIAVAAWIGKSKSIVQLKRAVSLDPADPALHFRLGIGEAYDLASSDPGQGIQQLECATDLSPHDTRYWRAVASACEFNGDKQCARHAISRALALSPMTPRVHWEAGNYYLWSNDQSRALSQFQRLLELDPGYAVAIFRLSLEATNSAERVYKQVLPPTASLKLQLSYVDFLAVHGHNHSAFKIWKKVTAGKSQMKFSLVNPYLECLIGTRHYQQAEAVWHDLEHLGILGQPTEKDAGNLVFNGGFEQVPLDAGFDWEYHQEPYVTVDFRARHSYRGKHCLRIDFFDVENHQDEPVYELIPVAANRNCRLSAYVRSANIDSHSCPRLRVIDPACPNCLSVTSSAVAGTTPWHRIVLDFRTGPYTHLVCLSVWRPRSLNYPTSILGTLWLDQVSLRVVAPFPEQAKRRQGA